MKMATGLASYATILFPGHSPALSHMLREYSVPLCSFWWMVWRLQNTTLSASTRGNCMVSGAACTGL